MMPKRRPVRPLDASDVTLVLALPSLFRRGDT
jgi:hypothetical protein